MAANAVSLYKHFIMKNWVFLIALLFATKSIAQLQYMGSELGLEPYIGFSNMGGAVGGEELVALVEIDGAEGIQRGLEGDEGVRLLHQGADGDAHVLIVHLEEDGTVAFVDADI